MNLDKFFEFTDRLIDKIFRKPKLNSFAKKIVNKEMFLYIIFGVLATVVSLVSFWIFEDILGKKYTLVTNVISWVITVTFAFITNKFFVFNSKSTKSKTLLKEISAFVVARLFSLGVEELGLAIAQYIFHADQKVLFSISGTKITKIIMQVIVVIMNYVFSKLFIFKKTDNESEEDQ